MKKFLIVAFFMALCLLPMTAFSFEKGESFALGNAYEIAEFVCYFIFVYLIALAKIFEHRNIIKNQVIE